MPIELDLDKHQLDDCRIVRGVPSGKIEELIQRLASVPASLRLKDLVNAAKSVLMDSTAADAIVRLGVSFNGLSRQLGLPFEETVNAIRDALVRESLWSPQELDQWQRLEPSFLQLVSNRAFRLVSKTIDLAYEYPYLYRRARVLTDVRPIFNEDAKQIEGAIVTFSLRLRYDGIGGDDGISIAMDEQDLRQLFEQCHRALAKARTLEDFIKRTGLPTFVAGETTND